MAVKLSLASMTQEDVAALNEMLQSFLDEDGVVFLWNKVKGLFNQGIKNLTISGTTLTYTKGDGSTGTIAIPQKTYNVFTGATASAAGSAGLVPAPSKHNSMPSTLSSNGEWANLFVSAEWSDVGYDVALYRSIGSDESSVSYVPIPVSSHRNDILGTFDNEKPGLVPNGIAGMDSNTKFLLMSGLWGGIKFNTTLHANYVEITPIIVSNYNGEETETSLSSFTLTVAASNHPGLLSKELYAKLVELPEYLDLETTYAKKTDLAGLYKYRGSVANESSLPTTNRTSGDVYNIVAKSQYGGAGTNVAWDGSKWDALGGSFTVNTISMARLEEILV